MTNQPEGMNAALAKSKQKPGWEEKCAAWLEKRKTFVKKRGGPTLLDLDE